MIGMIVRLNVKQGRSAALERAFAVQAQSVRANWATISISCSSRAPQPDTYTLVELYDDDHALAARTETPHIIANRAVMEPFIEGRPAVEAFDIVSHGSSI